MQRRDPPRRSFDLATNTHLFMRASPMFRTLSLRLFISSFLVSALAIQAIAENEGQEDLDKATQLKVAAENLEDLGEVIDHVDTALEKGLDKENTKFAE